jgi:transcriptional regulator with PAS, ATPase and Fis domain
LDEIGDMDQRLQAKLLRALQEGVVEPVGSNRRASVDVRIVSSTNRDLERAIAAGEFREDLFYRLNVFRIELPPLRDRHEDVPALASSFLAEFGREMGKGDLRLTEPAARALARYAWPGNVRELQNIMERAAVLAEDEVIGYEAVEALVPSAEDTPDEVQLDLAGAVAELERKTILRALAAADGNKPAAAKLLGIGERTLWSKLKRYGI